MSKTDFRAYALGVATTGAALGITRFTWPVFAFAPYAPLFGAVALTTQLGTWRASLLASIVRAADPTLTRTCNALGDL